MEQNVQLPESSEGSVSEKSPLEFSVQTKTQSPQRPGSPEPNFTPLVQTVDKDQLPIPSSAAQRPARELGRASEGTAEDVQAPDLPVQRAVESGKRIQPFLSRDHKKEEVPEAKGSRKDPAAFFSPLVPGKPDTESSSGEIKNLPPPQNIRLGNLSGDLNKGSASFPANRRPGEKKVKNSFSPMAEREADEIQIHIGRIEVTAVPPAPLRSAAKAAPSSPSLAEYLKRRDGRAS